MSITVDRNHEMIHSRVDSYETDYTCTFFDLQCKMEIYYNTSTADNIHIAPTTKHWHFAGLAVIYFA